MDSLEEYIYEKALAEGCTPDEADRKVLILRQALGEEVDADGNRIKH